MELTLHAPLRRGTVVRFKGTDPKMILNNAGRLRPNSQELYYVRGSFMGEEVRITLEGIANAVNRTNILQENTYPLSYFDIIWEPDDEIYEP